MKAQIVQWLNRLQGMSPREQIMVVVGVPLVLVVAAEFLVFDPARKQADKAQKQAELQQNETKALSATLAALPVVAPLPGADQLLKQRQELQAQIDAARAVSASVSQAVDWGTVVRATIDGTPGLTLTNLKTLPPELVVLPAMVKAGAVVGAALGARPGASPPAAAPVAAAAAASQPGLPAESIYRHRAELTIKGNFGVLLGYLQALQRVPGDLHWDRLQLNVADYPQASAQLTLYTLSNRAQTPFN